MNIENCISKIKNHQSLEKQEVDEIINLYCQDKISDQQILPFIKAIYDYDIDDKTLFFLTDAMLKSGEQLDLTQLGQVVDKHSTGGVSDTTSLVIAPVCAALGTKMLKLSGRSLGFTGGTCDKIECFEGYKTDIDINTAINLIKKNNACILTTSQKIAPADKKIYNLRDKTNLVDSIPLIASSVMSKKLATGANILVIDVKYGNGAFMQNKKLAKKLKNKIIAIAKQSNKKIKVVLNKMNQPLGDNIGPKLECMEAIQILNGKKGNLYKECVHLSALCVSLDKKIPYFVAKHKVQTVLKNKSALNKFKTMIGDQNGSLNLFDEQYPTPTLTVKSEKSGKIISFDTKQIGSICATMVDKDNKQYGIILNKKLGQKIQKNEDLFYVYDKDVLSAEKIAKQIKNCIHIN